MKEYTYNENEIELVRHLLNYTPKKIWWDFVRYYFDYGEYYIKLNCVDKIADSQNKIDEAIIGEITREENAFKPDKDAKLVCENKKIDNAHIVRTFLYFSTFRDYSAPEKLTNRIKHKLKTLLTGKKDPAGDLISRTTGIGEELICHPKSDEAKKVNPAFANLLDIGLLLEIEGKFFKSIHRN